MDFSGQYVRFKDKFKMQLMLTACAAGLMIVTLILFIFIPFFQITEEFFGETVVLAKFSIFDEIKLIIENFKNREEFSGEKYIAMFDLYHILAFFFIVLSVIIAAVDGFRAIFHLTSLEDYSLEQYDQIKMHRDERSYMRGFFRRKWNNMQNGPMSLFITGIILEAFGLFFSQYLSRIFEEEVIINSYFLYMNSISGSIFVVIFFAVPAIILNLYVNVLKRKTRVAILKEEFYEEQKKIDELM